MSDCLNELTEERQISLDEKCGSSVLALQFKRIRNNNKNFKKLQTLKILEIY